MATETTTAVRVCSLAELERDRFRVLSAEGRVILVLIDQGQVFALDNRCPHMGFPLHRGTVRDGILTCHWHHAKFDLAGGCTLDPFADDVPAFPVEVRDGDVYVDPHPIARDDRRQHWSRKLTEGLEQNIRLVLAKSVIGLDELGATEDVLTEAALFGVQNRDSGWSTGLSILTAMANVLPSLTPEDRRLALYHGLVHVGQSTAGQPPSFDLEPLDTVETRPERYVDWFRRFVDSRSQDAAERTLRTAIRLGLPQTDIATMVFAACTDHLYLDEGHSLDFANKAFELLDHTGWQHAETILPSIIPNLVRATRMEETSSWRHPVDLPSLLAETFRDLDDLIGEGAAHPAGDWGGHEALAETILDAEPATTVAALRDLIREGVPLTELSAAVAYAAARRPVHFHVSNEFGDWDTVHHTLTYTNAVDQALRRAPSSLLARGIFDGAMSVYLERFLNVPKQPIPTPSSASRAPTDLLASFDIQGQVDETAQVVTDLLAAGRHKDVIRTLGHALLREDAGFHQFQIYEAALRQYQRFAGTPAGDHVLIGAARFLTAHSPTVRAAGQTFDIAARLHRGEALHGDA
ncbi:MAG: Rieske 2Fe-2S domain-containing protein [Dehalococcoidia bacterium]|nr:Rieske 2Fe-2S domain-containing protein [Dehalococcoidia bacterium]